MKNIILTCLLLSSMAHAQVQDRIMDFKDQIDPEELEVKNIVPVLFEKKDEEGNECNLRFYFGFSRTDYAPTDLRLKSDVINIVIKDVEMHERTSAHHYNPANWEQIGDGRQFVIFDTKKAGKLSYTVKGDIGINTGKARSVQIVPGVAWDDYIDEAKVQGFNASNGHKLEYQRGIVSLFVDQKTIYSKMQHGFYDGTIDYKLRSTPTTFGIGIDLFTKKKKKQGD